MSISAKGAEWLSPDTLLAQYRRYWLWSVRPDA
jgi:hypothetical protein